MQQVKLGRRIVIVGASASGKSTLAKRLSTILTLPEIELDALHWNANWTEAPDFVGKVAAATQAEAWIVDGNYSKARDVTWLRAESIVWLDYPMWVSLWRVTQRTLQRSLRREVLWNGNRESLRDFLFDPESLFRWIIRTHKGRRRDYDSYITNNTYPHLEWVRLNSPRETAAWLKLLDG